MRVLSTEIVPVHSEALRAALKVGKAHGDGRAWDLALQHAPMGTKIQKKCSRSEGIRTLYELAPRASRLLYRSTERRP